MKYLVAAEENPITGELRLYNSGKFNGMPYRYFDLIESENVKAVPAQDQMELHRAQAAMNYHRVLQNREEILEAFVAKFGCQPEEVEQVEQTAVDGTRFWSVRKKQAPTVISNSGVRAGTEVELHEARKYGGKVGTFGGFIVYQFGDSLYVEGVK